MTENQQKYLRTANNNAHLLTKELKGYFMHAFDEMLHKDVQGAWGIVTYLSEKMRNTAKALIRAGVKTKKQ